MQSSIQNGESVGAVVGIVTQKGSKVFGFGHYSKDDKKVPDGKTLFEAGSLTKAFTTLILLDEIRAGSVKVDDPVTMFFPKDMPFPTRIRAWDEYLFPWKWKKDPPVTLWHLATHTSGFPNVPDIKSLPKSWKVTDVDYITEEMLRQFLGSFKFRNPPGEKCDYSIINTGLIAYALSQKEGKDFDVLLTERVLQPLGMDHSMVFPTEAQKRAMPRGYDDLGMEAPFIHSSMLTASSGGLHSTVNDLLRYMTYTLGLKEHPMAPMLQKECEPLIRINDHLGRTLGYGCYFSPKGDIVYQGGKTMAFHSYLVMVPSRRIGVVVWGNSAKFPAGRITDHILEILDQEGAVSGLGGSSSSGPLKGLQ